MLHKPVTLKQRSLTEDIGDLDSSCAGGVKIAIGAPIPPVAGQESKGEEVS